MAMYIYPYRTGSKSVKALAKELGIKQIKRERSRFRGGPDKTVINWGCIELPNEVRDCRIINPPEAVQHATNKLTFFKILDAANLGELAPPWTADEAVAYKWIEDKKIVVCRTVLAGHSGEGIVISEDPAFVVAAPLYTQYIPKKEEYRVHIVNGDVIDVARKARRKDHDDPNWQIRSWQNGFVFAREDCNPENCVLNVAIDAHRATGLDFGAVDVIYNEKQERAYVLEVNTAPGLEGQTIQSYANALRVL
jgi:glutathione synthase/RimK-type ligase-like ATP-grasp enzyme